MSRYEFLLTLNFVFALAFRLEKFDHFSQPKHGYDDVNGDIDSPTSFDEIERPPLRHIDKYLRAEIPGISTRYTVALMTMMGFIISFGMKCNMSAAKSEREKLYNHTTGMNRVSLFFKKSGHEKLSNVFSIIFFKSPFVHKKKRDQKKFIFKLDLKKKKVK